MAQHSFQLRSQPQEPVEKEPGDPNYPAIRYHRNGKSVMIHQAEQEPTGDDWAKQPFVPPPAAGPADTVESLTAKFNAAYDRLLNENSELKSQIEALSKKKKS